MRSSIELELEQLEHRRREAMVAGDRAALDEIYADDLILVHGDGSVQNKAQALASAGSFNARVHVPRALQIAVHGEVALLSGPITLAMDAADGERLVKVFIGQVAVRRAQRWQIAYVQVTMQPP